MNSVTCLDIEIAIMRKFNFRQNLIVTGVTDMNFLVPFETDVLLLTKSGYAHGFEIKVSKSDLKADFKKKQHAQMDVFKNGKSGFERYFGKFKYFSYAVPKELEEEALKQIPSFCGLYVCSVTDYGVTYLIEARSPKKLFPYKWSDKMMFEVARLGAMRAYNLKCAVRGYMRDKK
jgi:hypothetical protein